MTKENIRKVIATALAVACIYTLYLVIVRIFATDTFMYTGRVWMIIKTALNCMFYGAAATYVWPTKKEES